MRCAIIGLALVMASGQPALAQSVTEKGTPLFAEDEIIELRIEGPIGKIAREASRSTDPQPAMISLAGESHPIDLSARGKSRRRRDVCRFPPLRIHLKEKPAETSFMHRQRSLKLVTHCRDSSSYDQLVLREYTIYRLYNLVARESLKVRLARVTYVDDGRVIAERPGFLIEDPDDAARRVDLKEVDTGDLPVNALNREAAVRYALFQYLIGNTDWAMVAGPTPGDCCHNTKLFGSAKDARQELTPVPYDFDNAGLVDAPYAEPNAALRIRSVRNRVYRGFCATNALVPEGAARLISLRTAIEDEIRSIPGLAPDTQENMLGYLEAGLADLADASSIERKLLKKCR